VTVPINTQEASVEHAHELEAFVSAATKRGVNIWAVVGDPGAVIESERAVFARYPVAYARYNSECTCLSTTQRYFSSTSSPI